MFSAKDKTNNVPMNKNHNDIPVESPRNMVFAVYDEKAQAYSTVLGVHPTIEVAIRSFTIGCQNKESFYNRFPNDYILYCIGTYDERSGNIHPFNEPRFVVRASDIVPKINQEGKNEVNA